MDCRWLKFWSLPDQSELEREAGVDVGSTVLDISHVSTSVTRIQCARFTYSYRNIGNVIVNSSIVYLRVTRMVVSEVNWERRYCAEFGIMQIIQWL